MRNPVNAYKVCRQFGVGVLASAYRAVRYALTGKTGRYKISWRPVCYGYQPSGTTGGVEMPPKNP